MKRIAYFVSGNGSMMECCISFFNKHPRLAHNSLVIADRACVGLKKAEKYKIPYKLFDTWANREQVCDSILETCQKHNIDFMFLTFGKLLSGQILEVYQNKIANLHPGLLPAFKGFNATERAIAQGCRYIGATTHFIDESIDGGLIIAQGVVPIDNTNTIAAIRFQQYMMLKKLSLITVYLLAKDKIAVKGGRIAIKGVNYDSYPVNPSLSDPIVDSFLEDYRE